MDAYKEKMTKKERLYEATKKWRKKNKEKVEKYRKKYQKENRKRLNAFHRDYYKKNRIKLLEQAKVFWEKNREKILNGKLHRYTNYRLCAKRRKISFNLTKEQFNKIISQPCFYCDENIKRIGVDRLNSDLGYTVKNSVPCCQLCNYMKRTFKKRVFIKQCKKIAYNWRYGND